jgi:hypothetical protein
MPSSVTPANPALFDIFERGGLSVSQAKHADRGEREREREERERERKRERKKERERARRRD